MEKNKESKARKLMEEFPSFFPKNEKGETIPPDCGISFPDEWYETIRMLLKAIDSYTTNMAEHKRVILNPCRYYMYSAILSLNAGIHYLVFTYIINKSRINNVFNAFNRVVSTRRLKHFKFIRVSVAPVIITQIKTKFGSLRFYYSGGDKNIAYIVHTAVSLLDSDFLVIKK